MISEETRKDLIYLIMEIRANHDCAGRVVIVHPTLFRMIGKLYDFSSDPLGVIKIPLGTYLIAQDRNLQHEKDEPELELFEIRMSDSLGHWQTFQIENYNASAQPSAGFF